MLREAVKNKNTKPRQFILLEDRVATRNGKKQVYGSQNKIDTKTGENYFMPIKYHVNIDKRRADADLQPMTVNANTFNIIWNIEEHKEMIEKLELKKQLNIIK